MAVDGPFADVSSLSDDVTIDGESIYSQPSIVSHYSSYSGSHKSSSYSGHSYGGHSHSASYCGSLKSGNYSSVKNKRRTPPLVAPRPHHGSLKRLDRLPPPYARPSSAGLQDDLPEPGICKAKSTNLYGETFTSKLTVIPDPNRPKATSQNFGAPHFGQYQHLSSYQNSYQKPFVNSNNKDTWSPRRLAVPFAHAQLEESSAHAHVSRFEDHVYEDPEILHGPARLPPESGMLSKAQTKVVLRPLAFKPVMPHASKPCTDLPPGGDEGYHSTEFRHRADYTDPYRNPRDTNQTTHQTSDLRHQPNELRHNDLRHQSEIRHDSRPGSFNSSGHSRMSSGHTETYITTPSPSDSGVSELEAMLREKDAEISHLRETMDGNERAIFQVFEEKKRCWNQQMDKMIQDYEEKLRIEKQKAFKSEQSLLMQIVKLQQDKKLLNNDLDDTKAQLKDLELKIVNLEKDLIQSKSRADDSNWALHQKTGELSMIKTQIRDTKDESQQRYVEISNLRSKCNQYESELTDTKSQLGKLQDTFKEGKRQLQRSCQELDRLGLDKNSSFELSPGDRIANCDSDDESNSAFQNQEVKRLKNEMDKMKAEKRQTEQDFEEERSQWLDEKNKVICYQKQLQLNYVQMLRKNKCLEEEVEQLMLDLERNDLKTDSSC